MVGAEGSRDDTWGTFLNQRGGMRHTLPEQSDGSNGGVPGVWVVPWMIRDLPFLTEKKVIIRHGCMESTWLSTHRMEGIRPSARGCHKPIAVGESH